MVREVGGVVQFGLGLFSHRLFASPSMYFRFSTVLTHDRCILPSPYKIETRVLALSGLYIIICWWIRLN
jgi:hypothetical protein